MKFLLTLLAVLSIATLQGESPPNVVMIVSDDHHWSDYGFMGHAHIKTPHLDKLASQSLLFTRGYVPSSLCCPSLATMISGLYPHQNFITSNDPPEQAQKGEGRGKARKGRDNAAFQQGREVFNKHMDRLATLPRLLGKQGYVSFQTGKWWQGDFTRGGFTHGMTKGDRHGDDGLKIGRETMQPMYDFVNQAAADQKPFFLWYAPMLPHTPHNPPDRLLAKYRDKTPSEHIAKYWAMVEWFDETCGDLMKFLDDQKLAENTIVVYVTDNGWIQDPDKPRYADRSKQSQYDGGLRTPIMVRWPGKVKPRKSEALAMSIDLAPTLLKAVGADPQNAMQGINLLDEAAVNGRKTIHGEVFTHNSMNLEVPSASLRWRWMIDGDYKLIVPHAANESTAKVELFKITSDVNEERDLATAEPETVKALTAKLDLWWKP
jgi:arylsulfatase A-like enzyme